jgi:hypothetical protein
VSGNGVSDTDLVDADNQQLYLFPKSGENMGQVLLLPTSLGAATTVGVQNLGVKCYRQQYSELPAIPN